MSPHIWPKDIEFTSSGERIVFEALKKALRPDDFLIVGYKFHEPKVRPFLDIDFLLIRPTAGALIMEVKGGDISFNPEINDWVRKKERTSERLNLYSQISDEYHGYKRRINHITSHLPMPSPRWAVVFPHSLVGESLSSEITRANIIDKADLAIIGEYLEKILPDKNPWTTNTSWARTAFSKLIPGAVDDKKSFEYNLTHFLNNVDEHSKKLSKIISLLSENSKFEVNGTAGSGKTLIAIELARKWCDLGLNVAILVTNKQLASHLSFLTIEWRNKPVWIGSRDSFGALIRSKVSESLTYKVSGNQSAISSSDVVPVKENAVLSKFIEDELELGWDALIIDEAQDIKPSRFDILDYLISRTSKSAIFSDKNQCFGTHTIYTRKDFLQLRLDENVRNNHYVAELCNRLTGESSNSLISLGTKPDLYLVGNQRTISSARDSILEELLNAERWNLNQIAIVYLRRDYGKDFTFISSTTDLDRALSGERVLKLPVEGIKGLEREVVILVLEEFDFKSKRDINRLYTSISRAMVKLIVVSKRDFGLALFEKSLDLFNVLELNDNLPPTRSSTEI